MTKKAYIKLAELIKDSPDNDTYTTYKALLITGLCNILKEDNPRFDREQFIAACNS